MFETGRQETADIVENDRIENALDARLLWDFCRCRRGSFDRCCRRIHFETWGQEASKWILDYRHVETGR